MTISHHPPEELLLGFAKGALSDAEHLVIGVHVAGCRSCSRLVLAMEELAAACLEDTGPAPMAADAFDAIIGRLDAPVAREARAPQATIRGDMAELPKLLHGRKIGKRRRVAPGVSMRPIEVSGTENVRAFLLESAAGTHMLEHTHTGRELTCVLKGSFSHEGGRYGPGDFDYGDDDTDHRPTVGNEGPCLCLVAMSGGLRINGLLGRLISPFVRL